MILFYTVKFIKNTIFKQNYSFFPNKKKGANMKTKLGLTIKIFIGLILGSICGIILYGIVLSSMIKDDILIDCTFI